MLICDWRLEPDTDMQYRGYIYSRFPSNSEEKVSVFLESLEKMFNELFGHFLKKDSLQGLN